MTEGCDYVRVEHGGGPVATVVIDRPQKRNALDRGGWQALADAFEALASDTQIRCVILTGVPGAFCAGDDIGAFAAVQDDPAARQGYWDTIMRCYAALAALPMPLIAAVDGPCIGGGCTLALRADFRIAGPMASFGVPPARLGLVYPAQSAALLGHIVGDSFARYMLYSGRQVGTAEAIRAGLALDAAGQGAREFAIEFSEAFIHSAPISVRAAKMVMNAVPEGRLAEVAPEIERLSIVAESSADRREGLAAFSEKRLPRFGGV